MVVAVAGITAIAVRTHRRHTHPSSRYDHGAAFAVARYAMPAGCSSNHP